MKKLMITILIGFNFLAFGQETKKTTKSKTEIEILLEKGIKPELAFFWETKRFTYLTTYKFQRNN